MLFVRASSFCLLGSYAHQSRESVQQRQVGDRLEPRRERKVDSEKGREKLLVPERKRKRRAAWLKNTGKLGEGEGTYHQLE